MPIFRRDLRVSVELCSVDIQNPENRVRYAFGDVVIEKDSFRLYRDGELLPLTPKAFDVLLFLIGNRQRVVEKQELFDTLWKDSFVTDDALIRTVKEIRQVLGDDAAAPRYIETVRKRGYRFIGKLQEESD